MSESAKKLIHLKYDYVTEFNVNSTFSFGFSDFLILSS
jgi:hypothetical protein